jgi:hypothetical protein
MQGSSASVKGDMDPVIRSKEALHMVYNAVR